MYYILYLSTINITDVTIYSKKQTEKLQILEQNYFPNSLFDSKL